ncbi:MAG TPA: ankyrin repeat domain-containing protein, partial [Anaerolineales bacterium]|nr:ankyrin repeat domain-containing protein [Anaerolineales bacterium]
SCKAISTPLPTVTSPAISTSTFIPAVTPSPEPLVSPTPQTISTPTPNPNQGVLDTMLIQAAESGDTPTVLSLLDTGANVNATDERGRTAVMAATHTNQVETVRTLINAGADINIRDNRLNNPFLYASAEGLFEIVKLTIDARADPRLTNRFGGTALIPAAERGHIEIVQELLTRTDVDVNHINNLGWTALLEAIILSDGGERHQQIVQLLVDHGANITIPDKDGITPLEHARARGFGEIEQILLATEQTRGQQLIRAAEQGDIGSVEQLLGLGANVEVQDENGRTALIAAAYENNLPIANLLIQAGADVNKQDNTQQSAYLIATSEGFLELLKVTLQAGADVYSKDSYNGTGLIRAADRGHVEIIQELLKTDIEIDHINNLGWTALLEAIILGDGGARHTEVVRLLVEAGADVNLADFNGITPLAHARQRGYQQIMEILSAAGAHE